MRSIRNPIFLLAVFCCLSTWSLSAHTATLYENTFDSTSDWTSADRVIPEGWYSYRADPTWAPSTGFPLNHEPIEILSSNADKARGGVGKSAVFWRESNTGQYRNDKILAHRIAGGADAVYVEFYLSFSPSWTISGTGPDTSKLFRIYSWNENGTTPPRLWYFGPGRNAGPVYFWNYTQHEDYGQRNFMAFRGGPYGENYFMTRPEDFPRQVNNGDSSLSFTTDLVTQGINGTSPRIPDRVNGGFLSDDMQQIVRHEQVFGWPADRRWTKLAFYVRMNSAPGVPDGVLMQWIDDVQTFNQRKISWIGPTNNTKDIKWDVVAIGGNDYFGRHPASERYEEWYAIDDIVVLDTIPDHLGGVGAGSPDANSGYGECAAN